MIAALGLSPTDAVIVIAAIGYAVKVIADQRGWTRSTALVRQENADLRERNATLAAEVDRLDKADRQKSEELAVLREQVDTLKKHDQAAVLDAVAALAMQAAGIVAQNTEHEHRADMRSAKREAEHGEAMGVFRSINEIQQQILETLKERT